MRNIYQAHLEPFKKTDSCARMGYKLHLSNLPYSYSHSSHFAQPKDIPLKLLVFNLTTIYNMDSRCYNKRSPYQMHLVFLYALISISSNFCCLHHSSTSTPHIIYHFLEQHVYFTKSVVQWSLAMTNLVVQIDNKKKNSYQKNMLPCSFILPLILPSIVNYTNLSSMQ